MLEVDLAMTVAEALHECTRRGLVVRSERELTGQPGSGHWHLGYPGRAETIELSASGERVWLKVHPLRDGGWASALARDIAHTAR